MLSKVGALEDLLPEHFLVLAHHLLPRGVRYLPSFLRHWSLAVFLHDTLRLLRRLAFLKRLSCLFTRLIIDCVTVGVVSWYATRGDSPGRQGGRVQTPGRLLSADLVRSRFL
jgi:hypothetical protein